MLETTVLERTALERTALETTMLETIRMVRSMHCLFLYLCLIFINASILQSSQKQSVSEAY
jgi:hypothetical protein